MEQLAHTPTKLPNPAPLFKNVLGDEWGLLPPQLQALHSQEGQWKGSVQVQRGEHFLARLLNRWLGLPNQLRRAPATVSMHRQVCAVTGQASEGWLRRFGAERDYSTSLTRHGDNCVRERFGSLAIVLALRATRLGLVFTAHRAYAFGMPLPKFLTPKVSAYEHVHGQRCYFSVKVKLPLVGLLTHYHGWLLVEDAA